ncbi:hypothetical protein, partial [Acinetobacter baumannii]|uniref:hypothetical protein n=1 Tax=Acinetobacter baumannii TaxID=470 RepID=UPI0013D34AA6
VGAAASARGWRVVRGSGPAEHLLGPVQAVMDPDRHANDQARAHVRRLAAAMVGAIAQHR